MNTNIFDESFRRLAEFDRQANEARNKLFESKLELKNAQRLYHAKQKELADVEAEFRRLQAENKKVTTNILKAIIERDRLLTKKAELTSSVERATAQHDALEKDTTNFLTGDDVEEICRRYSISAQISLLNKIHDARRKLMEIGFPTTYFI